MKIRVVVPVYNEQILLPYFLDHYSYADSILVFDNGSTDRTVEIAKKYPRVMVHSFTTDGYDEMAVLNQLHSALDESVGFDWVLLPDCDEFVTTRSGIPMRKVLGDIQEKVARASGYCMVQTGSEGTLEPGKPLIHQRRFGFRSPEYSKPFALRPGLGFRFTPGKHRLVNQGFIQEVEEIVLLHMELVDYSLWVYRKTRRPLSRLNQEKGFSVRRFCRTPEFYEGFWMASQKAARDLSVEIPVLEPLNA